MTLSISKITGVETFEAGVRIPATLPYPHNALTDLISGQLEVLGDDSACLIPEDQPPAAIRWRRNDHKVPNMGLNYELSRREIDEFIRGLWVRIHKMGSEPAVHPVYIRPWYYPEDSRINDGICQIAMPDFVSAPFCIAFGATFGNNVFSILKGFEELSAQATLAQAVRVGITLDLKGVEVSYQDDRDDAMLRNLGAQRERVLDSSF